MITMKNLRRDSALFSMVLAALFALAGTPAHAQASGRCDAQLSESLVDYGRMTRAQLLERQPDPARASLGKRLVTLTAVCAERTAMALSFQGAAADDTGFRFAANDRFTLRIVQAQLDGKPVRLAASQADATNSAPSSLLRPGDRMSPMDGASLAQGQRLTVQLEIEPFVGAGATRVAAESTWEGAGRFEVLRR
ncbi:hypothetical protein FFI97_007080 [Variovorax sp. KBS0712]|uniref:hypothetical protein n=1 Tax=Variovorax sp. KBS0712 TaxID=2578111 RepID=UPI00111910D4|nr:hypothetical protein [Variovorax sp. KBS0712]TSD60055.1 hypothetical protein FFI97_007080 [Variovorax sp. KBS0712]